MNGYCLFGVRQDRHQDCSTEIGAHRRIESDTVKMVTIRSRRVTACAAETPSGAALSLFTIVAAINSANSGNNLTSDKESEGDEKAPADREHELLRRGPPLRLVKCCRCPGQVFFSFAPGSFGSVQPTHT